MVSGPILSRFSFTNRETPETTASAPKYSRERSSPRIDIRSPRAERSSGAAVAGERRPRSTSCGRASEISGELIEVDILPPTWVAPARNRSATIRPCFLSAPFWRLSARALPTAEKRSNKVGTRRWIFGGLSALALAGLVVFHAALLAGRFADASIAHPEVIAQWVGAVLLGVGALALRRQGSSLVSGRGALVFWLLVLLLHVGFGSGITLTGEEIGGTRELLLLVPFASFAGFAATGASAVGRARRSRLRRQLMVALRTLSAGLRFSALRPAPRDELRGRRARPFLSPPPAFLLSTSVVLPASRPPGVPAA